MVESLSPRAAQAARTSLHTALDAADILFGTGFMGGSAFGLGDDAGQLTCKVFRQLTRYIGQGDHQESLWGGDLLVWLMFLYG